jgi:hypothetical protein
MNKKNLIPLLFSLIIVLTACSSTPNTPEGVACEELRKTQELISKELDSDLQERLESGSGGGASEDLLDEFLSAYMGIANRYTSKVNDPELKSQLLELLKTAGGSKEEANFRAPAQAGKILEWCESKKY